LVIRKTGEVAPGFYVLGHPNTPIYLKVGERSVLFDAGFTFLGQTYVEALLAVLGERTPDILFLTHAHFDHCGTVGHLKEAFPKLKVAASARAAEILAKPKALDLIKKLNRSARPHAEAIGLELVLEDDFKPFNVDIVLSEGEEIDLGKESFIRVMETPGHTRDFLSYYLPHEKILIASEAVGCSEVSDHMMVEFVADYDSYLTSLRRLSKLDVDLLCQGHNKVFTGEDVGRHFSDSISATEDYKSWVEELLAEEDGDLVRVVERIKVAEWEKLSEPKQPLDGYLLNTEARVRCLAARKGLL